MLIPSIDLMGGKAVQLVGGRTKILEVEDVLGLALRWRVFGELAVIDLDAALGQGDNLELVKELCRVARCRVGGGVRTVERAHELLRAGAARVIIGTAASEDFLARLPRERAVVAVDQNHGRLQSRGWRTDEAELPMDRVRRLAPFCGGFLMTVVDKEGRLEGVGWEAAREIRRATQLPVTYAGGVGSAEDVAALDRLGLDAQVGMALYRGLLGARPSISRGRAGVAAERGQEGDEGLGGSKDEESDAASRQLPPQPEGLSAKGPLAVLARSDDGIASPLTRLRAIEPFALNATPGEYLDGLLDPTEAFLACLDWEKQGGLIPAAVQDEAGRLRMLAWQSRESLRQALNEGKGIYWSRSRGELWEKGKGSGNRQALLRVEADCDRDTLRFVVAQTGPACHSGTSTCFGAADFALADLEATLQQRKLSAPEGSYTARLFREDGLLEAKLREETEEVIQARTPDEQVWETADLLYFLMVRMTQGGIRLEQVLRELERRHTTDTRKPGNAKPQVENP